MLVALQKENPAEAGFSVVLILAYARMVRARSDRDQ
jgi:hypothetical protein